MTPVSKDWSFLDDMNMTELTQMAFQVNPNVHRSLPRETLCRVVQGEEIVFPRRNIDGWRRAIFEFVDTNWRQVSPLVTCPMKARQPEACFQCLDIQVAECATENQRNLTQIRKKKQP